MKIEDFNIVINTTFDKCKDILTNKGNVRHNHIDNERLEQFKRLSRLRNCHITDAVYRVGLDKHLTILYKLVDDAEAGVFANPSIWDESILDAINYLAILRAVVIENWTDVEKGGLRKL